jgi:hypothetical protein
MSNTTTEHRLAIERSGARLLLGTMKDLLVLMDEAGAPGFVDKTTHPQLANNFESLARMADLHLARVQEIDPEFDSLAPVIVAAGDPGLLRYVADAPPKSRTISHSAIKGLARSRPVSYFRDMLAKGVDPSMIMLPLMQVSDARPDIRAFLMDELADKHIAVNETGDDIAWVSIVDIVTKGPECAIEMILRQRAAFPDQVNDAAIQRWKNGRSFNTILHLLLGAPQHIFEAPTRTTTINTPLFEAFRSGHGMLRMIRHFGDLQENRRNLQSLYDKYVNTLGARRP